MLAFGKFASRVSTTVLKRNLIVVHVNCITKEGCENLFKEECILNGNKSIKEKGIARFDIVQEQANPRHFRLCEVYYNEEAMKSHRETKHFIRFNEACEKYLFEPRTRCVFDSICPEEKIWIADVEKENCAVCLQT